METELFMTEGDIYQLWQGSVIKTIQIWISRERRVEEGSVFGATFEFFLLLPRQAF
jgi:hypothetical protein